MEKRRLPCEDDDTWMGIRSPLLLQRPVAALTPIPVAQVLVVTKGFAAQEGLLGASDLAALSAVVRGTPAVGFYNSGLEAGARCVLDPRNV